MRYPKDLEFKAYRAAYLDGWEDAKFTTVRDYDFDSPELEDAIIVAYENYKDYPEEE